MFNSEIFFDTIPAKNFLFPNSIANPQGYTSPRCVIWSPQVPALQETGQCVSTTGTFVVLSKTSKLKRIQTLLSCRSSVASFVYVESALVSGTSRCNSDARPAGRRGIACRAQLYLFERETKWVNCFGLHEDLNIVLLILIGRFFSESNETVLTALS